MQLDYFIVVVNPNQTGEWLTLKTVLKAAEAKHVVYFSEEVSKFSIQKVCEEEFYEYDYCQN